MNNNNTITINENNAGLRLDNFLIRIFSNIPRAAILSFIRKRKIRINGKRITENAYRLRNGDILTYYFYASILSPTMNPRIPALKKDQIFYEDEGLLVVYKYYNTVMHSHEFSLNEQVREYLMRKKEVVQDLAFQVHHIHRIDRETKGLVVYAKTKKSQNFLYDQFYNKKVKKGYYAVIKKTLKYSFDKWTELAGHIIYKDGYFQILSKIPTPSSKLARIKVKKIQTIGNNKSVLLRIICYTGRKHQIRILLSENGTPIINDQKYSNSKRDNLLLFSYLLEFKKTSLYELSKYKFEVDKEKIISQILDIMGWKC